MTPRKPRKMPKNQRAYPKGKPRLVQVTGYEELILRASAGDISAPPIFQLLNGNGGIWVEADKLKKWRALRNPSETGAEHGK